MSRHLLLGLIRQQICRAPKGNGAGNEVRTRDLNLGKVALYQLSYSRIALILDRRRTASTVG
jgi:hypothetical protein